MSALHFCLIAPSLFSSPHNLLPAAFPPFTTQNQPTPARTYYYKTELHETTLEYTPHIKDLVTISTPI